MRAASRLGPQMGVRSRSVLVAVVVVLVALVAGGTGLVFALQSNLEQSVEATGRARAAEVVSRIATDGVTRTSTALAEQGRTDAVTQILAADGSVVGTSRRVADRALSAQRPPVGEYVSVELDLDTLDEGGEWKVITTAVTAPDQSQVDQTYYIQVGVPIRVQRDTVQTVAVFLLAGTPLLLGAVASAVWVLVGRALRSVERIRMTVAEIDARALTTARLEVPPTRDEIAALATTMNVMLDRLQASDRAQRAFVSDASHELRSPLATVSAAAELAVSSTDDDFRTRLLQTMNAELTRMRGLVDNLMALARTDAHDVVLAPTEVDLDDLVEHEARRLRTTSSHQVQLRMEPVRVWADLGQIAQALRNLVDNAARHARSTVRLTLTAQDGQAVIWVDNDGPVIDPADRERVFERFVRLDDSRSRDVGGSGLGLAITRSALQAQRAVVCVVDSPDGWCRFEVRMSTPTQLES